MFSLDFLLVSRTSGLIFRSGGSVIDWQKERGISIYGVREEVEYSENICLYLHSVIAVFHSKSSAPTLFFYLLKFPL